MHPISRQNAAHYVWGGSCDGWHLVQATGLSNQGVVRLSKLLKPLAKIDAAHVWDVTEDGALILSTYDRS